MGGGVSVKELTEAGLLEGGVYVATFSVLPEAWGLCRRSPGGSLKVAI